MSELLEKLKTNIFENLPEILKDVHDKIVVLDDEFLFGDADIVVYIEGQGYVAITQIEVVNDEVIVRFKNKFDVWLEDLRFLVLKNESSKPLKELEAPAILAIYEYVMVSD